MEPLRWARPRRIFWNAHGDLFHENVPDEWIDRCFAVMALTPQHVHQVLTKRPERMWEYVAGRASKLARVMVDEYLIRGTKDAKRTGRAINVARKSDVKGMCVSVRVDHGSHRIFKKQ